MQNSQEEFILSGRGTGFCQISNLLFDFWGKIIGAEAIRIYCGFKSFIESSRDDSRLFPKISQSDWADYFGISHPTFHKNIKVLIDVNLIRIKKRKSENKIPLPSIYFLEEIHLPTKETLNKYQIKPLKNTNFLNYIYVNYAKKALKSMNNVSVPKNSLGTGTLKFFRYGYIKNFNHIIEYYSSIENNIINDKSLICVSDETHKSSLKKQMGLGNNSNQSKPPKKKGKLTDEEKEIISSKLEKNLFAKKILSLWNDMPGAGHHLKPSKTWLQVVKRVNQLRSGTLIKENFPKDFLERNKISPNLLARKFSEREIIETLNKIPPFFKEGFFLREKNFSNTLPNIIYNDYSFKIKSLFLIAYVSEAKPVGETIRVVCKYPHIAQRLKNTDTFDFEKADATEKRKFNQIFVEIDERLKLIPKTNYLHPNLESFFVDYRDALKGQGIKIRLWSYSPASWEWKKIIVLNTQPFNQIIEWMRGKGEKEKKGFDSEKYTFVQTLRDEDEIENIDSF